MNLISQNVPCKFNSVEDSKFFHRILIRLSPKKPVVIFRVASFRSHLTIHEEDDNLSCSRNLNIYHKNKKKKTYFLPITLSIPIDTEGIHQSSYPHIKQIFNMSKLGEP